MGLLHKAVLSGNSECVEYLLKNYPETATIVDNVSTKYGTNSLGLAYSIDTVLLFIATRIISYYAEKCKFYRAIQEILILPCVGHLGCSKTPKKYLYHIKVLKDASTVQIRVLIDYHMFQSSR